MNAIRHPIRKLAIALVLFAIASTKLEAVESPRLHESFDANWRFHLGDSSGAEDPKFDTSTWRHLGLPHDWSAEGEFSRTNASCTGYLPGGIGWYRKTFNADPSWADPTILTSPTKNANDGQVLALVQSGLAPGELALKVHASGLQAAKAKLHVDNSTAQGSLK